MDNAGERIGFWWRVLAALIDGVFVVVLGFALMAVAQAGQLSQLMFDLIWLGSLLLYSTSEVLFRGTPGKLLLGLRIAAINRAPGDGWRLFLRWSTKQLPLVAMLLFSITAWPLFYLLQGISALFVAIGCLYAANDDKLAWHDQWAGTAVFPAATLKRPVLSAT